MSRKPRAQLSFDTKPRLREHLASLEFGLTVGKKLGQCALHRGDPDAHVLKLARIFERRNSGPKAFKPCKRASLGRLNNGKKLLVRGPRLRRRNYGRQHLFSVSANASYFPPCA